MQNEQPFSYETEKPARRIGTMPLLFALFCLAGVALGIWVKDRQEIDAANTDKAQMAANLNQALAQSKNQVQELSSRLDALVVAQARTQSQAQAQAPAAKPVVRNGKNAVRRKSLVAKDPRIEKLQGQLSETQQELARTKDDISKTRDDLNGSLAQTRDELNGSIAQTRDELAKSHQELAGQIDSARNDLGGSIAKTHEEVLALRKRGEQNVYEFRLDRNKQFDHVGPLSLGLRATNPKHKTYDLAMIVEDNTLSKKHVNLYEPIWIRMSDRPQAVELVVNRIDKDRITGYVTEPKYKRSELASTSEKAPEKAQQLETR